MKKNIIAGVILGAAALAAFLPVQQAQAGVFFCWGDAGCEIDGLGNLMCRDSVWNGLGCNDAVYGYCEEVSWSCPDEGPCSGPYERCAGSPLCTACGPWIEAGSCGTNGCAVDRVFRSRSCNLPAGCAGAWMESDCNGDNSSCSGGCVPGPTVDLGCDGGCGATAMRQTDGCSTWCVPGHPSCAACVPGPWVSQGCGPAGGCAVTAMYQTNGCTGQCVAGHPACLPNNPPSISSVAFQEPDYCAFGVGGTVAWIFFDPDGDMQGFWQVQVLDSGLGTVVYDSGKQAGGAAAVLAQGQNLVSSYGRNLYARVMVWDSKDIPSVWTQMSSCAPFAGQINGCAGGTSWNAPAHRYPSNVDFTFTPPLPSAGRPVQFDDSTTTCYDAGNNPIVCSWYNWQFGDGDSIAGNFPAPQHIYGSTGAYTVQMSARDASGFTCSAAPKIVGIQLPIPKWIEVLPR